MTMDKQEVTLLVRLDLSATFDIVSHYFFFNILENDCGVTDSALKWFQSSRGNQRILIDNSLSHVFNST